jgi:hypothetical protein
MMRRECEFTGWVRSVGYGREPTRVICHFESEAEYLPISILRRVISPMLTIAEEECTDRWIQAAFLRRET